jgi:DNA-binding transcriptional LysR family regulator
MCRDLKVRANSVRIAELRSLSVAAREPNLSPSAVSKILAQLEDRLGVLLAKLRREASR